jgi:uncharacterized protein (DUF2147 family)
VKKKGYSMRGWLLVLIAFFIGSLGADEIIGFWKSINDETGKAQCIVGIYEYDGKFYGRIIGTFDDDQKLNETIYAPKERAPGVIGNPFYCGLDIIWDLVDNGISYKGKILDPQKGNVYNSEVWLEKGKLIVRGKLLFLGRNQQWVPAANTDFPQGFKKPNLGALVPVIPQVR